MSARTPGPWQVSSEIPSFVVAADGFIVADTDWREPAHPANARFIAAAPDMAAVLLRWDSGGCYARESDEDYSLDCSTLRPDDPCAACEARAVLRKAGVL